VLADAAYRDDATLAARETRASTAYVSLGREGKATPVLDPTPEATRRMAERLASAEGQARYRRRKAIVEPVFGWIKHALGFRCFSVRGEAPVRGEWSLVCLAVNLKHWHRLRPAV
jgi:hypothetical protein